MKKNLNTVPEPGPRIDSRTLAARTIRFPPVRLLIALVYISPAVLVFNLVYGKMLDVQNRWTSGSGDVAAVIIVGMTMGLYWLYVKSVERRPVREVGLRTAGHELMGGIALGVFLVALTTIPIVLGGFYALRSMNPAIFLVHGVFVFAMLAFFEELIFRCILFRLGEELLGTWMSLVFVACVFGAAHLQHEKATLLSALAIAIQDLVLTGAFVLTRKIWMSWGIHWGWNLAQDGVLGMPNSSLNQLPSWLHPVVSGPDWLTGGEFGIELSVVGIALNVAAGIVLMKMAVGRHLVEKAPWRRDRGERDFPPDPAA